MSMATDPETTSAELMYAHQGRHALGPDHERRSQDRLLTTEIKHRHLDNVVEGDCGSSCIYKNEIQSRQALDGAAPVQDRNFRQQWVSRE